MNDIEREVIEAARRLVQDIDRLLASLAPFGRRSGVENPVERELRDATADLRDRLRHLDEA